MFTPIEGGSEVDVQGLPCQLAAPGFIYDYDRSEWLNDSVHKHARAYEDCYWRIDPRFADVPVWGAWVEEERIERDKILKKKGAKAASEYEHPELGLYHKELKHIRSYAELSQFMEDCWRWRFGGYWYYNNNVPTYITGLHWFYLSCYHIIKDHNPDLPDYAQDLPDYRDKDREIWYAWEYADEDPHSLGLNLVMKRRGGKTYISGCIALEKATRRKKFNVGIQSKTEDDAKEVFLKAVIEPFRRLPFFFQPVSDIPRNNTPATALNFKTGKMNTSQDAELGSKIDYLPSKEKAYDGKRLGFYIDDECGKTEVVNVQRRWNIVRNCLLDNTRKVVGKSLHTTTVDEMEAGGAAFFKIWEGSNQRQRNKLGRTNTGLFNFFVPANFMGQADKYGYPDHERELEEILALRESETDPRSLADLKRQFPLTEREAFSADGSTCSFSNIIGLTDQLEALTYIPARFKVGNFQWVEGVPDTTVEFIESKKGETGRFAIAWMPEEGHRNLKRQRMGVWYPTNTDMACGGCDPYDHRMLTVEGAKTMSKGAITFVKLPNVLAPSDIDDGPCLLYINRPAAPEIFYEDCLMACVFFGCEILIEDNKSGCIDHFTDRGYGGYLAWLDGRTKPGITNTSPTSGGGVNANVFALLDSYITHHIVTCLFPILIEQLLKFTVTDTTQYDAAMSFGFAKILQKKLGIRMGKRVQAEKAPDITSILPASMYANGGATMFGY